MALASNQVRGLNDALKTLGKIDPVLRRVAVKRLKDDVQPVVSAMRSAMPAAPLSNWVAPRQSSARRGSVEAGRSGAKGTPFWKASKARSGIRSSVKKQSVRAMKGKAMLISIRQNDAAGVVFDMAGKKSHNVFTRNLSDRFGSASRVLWPVLEKNKPRVLRSIEASVVEMEREINRALRSRVN